ncbi:WG repeat-containing protein [Pelatocladus sp. BLCC-F211]|uniref:WG repeat-containing protein n=1 Tax=Pelatocladus sp. BLCC-F211 TaxID=3342752 RepID=UPI0035B72061
MLQKIQYNRDRGIKGEVLFFYEGLRENNDELAKALQSGAYAKTVTFNTASVKVQGFTRDRHSVSYSYINISGTTASQPQYDWVDEYSQGLARVRMGFKWGYIDASGQLVGKLRFDAAEPSQQEGFVVRTLVLYERLSAHYEPSKVAVANY